MCIEGCSVFFCVPWLKVWTVRIGPAILLISLSYWRSLLPVLHLAATWKGRPIFSLPIQRLKQMLFFQKTTRRSLAFRLCVVFVFPETQQNSPSQGESGQHFYLAVNTKWRRLSHDIYWPQKLHFMIYTLISYKCGRALWSWKKGPCGFDGSQFY